MTSKASAFLQELSTKSNSDRKISVRLTGKAAEIVENYRIGTSSNSDVACRLIELAQEYLEKVKKNPELDK